ncbi:MAG: helix-turn-helix transcriptional regulator [bacterium]|nr:helix-turn-helix transcriptional regulator [bacterium]
MRNIKDLLGKRIKEIRKRKGLTQEKLAEFAGIETPSMSNIENGKNYPNHETLEKISNALGVKPYELYIFDYHLPKEELIKEMVNTMEKDENLTQKMYQYFICVR